MTIFCFQYLTINPKQFMTKQQLCDIVSIQVQRLVELLQDSKVTKNLLGHNQRACEQQQEDGIQQLQIGSMAAVNRVD